MKFKLSFLLLMIMLLSAANAIAATTVIIDNDSSSCQITGSWTSSNHCGYKLADVIETQNGSVLWVDKTMQGVAKVSLWISLDEEGATDATINLRTEHTIKEYPISFAEGNSGWRDIGFVQVSGGGLFVTLKSGTIGKTYASAIKIEYLDSAYRSLDTFTSTHTEHIIFGTHASIGYKNLQKVDMMRIPEIDGENAYISKEAVFRYLGSYVEEGANKITFRTSDKEFSADIDADSFMLNGQNTQGCLATVDEGETLINIALIARNIGKEVFISKRGLVIISNQNVVLDEKTDKREINNILSVLRNEEM